MALDRTTLRKEWDSLQKDWYSIYQWQRITGVGYSEWVAEWLTDDIATITLIAAGLRQRSFRLLDHTGQLLRQTGLEQINEKRLVRAMFNCGSIPGLGRMIDYETPLKETDDATHGDIDLLCVQPDSVLCLEAKNAGATESVIKAILQAFTYTSLIATQRQRFLADFNLSPTLLLTPAVLTFASASSGRQLRTRDMQPCLVALIHALNDALSRNNVQPLRFFVVEDRNIPATDCLVTSKDAQGVERPIFRDGFVWKVTEHPI